MVQAIGLRVEVVGCRLQARQPTVVGSRLYAV